MTAAQTARGRSRLRVGDWRVRTKLGVILVIPTLLLLAVSGVQIRTQLSDAMTLRDYTSQVQLAQRIAGAVHELQDERDRTVGELAKAEAAAGRAPAGRQSGAAPSVELNAQRAAVDHALDGLRRAGTGIAGGKDWQNAYDQAMRELTGLAAARTGIDAATLTRQWAYHVYMSMIDTLLTLLAAPVPGPENAALDQSRASYLELARMKELASQQRARIFAASLAGFSAGDYGDIADLRALRLATETRFRGAAPAAQRVRYEAELGAQVPDYAFPLEQAMIDSAGRPGAWVKADAWWRASTERHDRIRSVEAAALADAADAARHRSSATWRQTWLVIGGIGLAMLVALIVSVLVGRSMARSLRILRREALRVALVELPQVLERLRDVRGQIPEMSVRPPGVRAADEIGEVADAFAAVHASAVSLAVEQATMRRNVNTMFVNLARRSQVLVERQIELLDRVERDGQDPDLLDYLYKLDQLAARMRRNDDSLLVLAGSDNARRWKTSAAVSAVLLAASAGVEQHARILHNADDSWHVTGRVVADLVHLLAELLENATAFSPPDTTVRILGSVVSGHVVIDITDGGIGMSPVGLEEANALLDSPQDADVAASERMGLSVVGHLAARHGIRERLHAADPGVVASVWLPPQLLTPPPLAESPPPQPPAPADVASLLAEPAAPSESPPAEPLPAGKARRWILPLPPVDLVFSHARSRDERAGRSRDERAGRSRDERAGRSRDERAGRSRRGRARRTGNRPVEPVSAWWSQTGEPPTPTGGAAAPAPPEVPITGGINDRGLPVRVPMAQLPSEEQAIPPGAAGHDPVVSRAEPDPDEVGSTLSRFYGGVRRAEVE